MPIVPSRFEHRLLAAFLAGASAVLLLGMLTWNFSVKAVDATRFVIQTHEVIASLDRLQFQLYRAESEQRGYLISGNDAHLSRARRAMEATLAELDRLIVQVADTPSQHGRARGLRDATRQRIALLEKNIALDDKLPGIRPGVDITEGSELGWQIDRMIRTMQDEEHRLLKHRQNIESERAQLSALAFLALMLAMMLALPALYFRMRDGYREKQKSAAETARLVAVIESSPDLIATSTPDGRVSYINRAGRAMLGIGDLPASGVRRDRIYAPWALDLILGSAVPTAVASGSWRGETAFLNREGKEIPVSQVIVSHRQQDGTLTLSTIARDISERKMAQQLLEEKNAQVEQASRMKTEFLATMSHELRTPLNAIIGFSSLISDGQSGEQTRNYARDILASGRHLLALINDILDLSTIESGHMRLEPGVIDGDELALDAQTIVREQAAANKVRISARLSPELRGLWLDTRKTRQIMINLLSNAVKFSREGSEVRLSMRLVPRSEVEAQRTGQGRRLFPLAASDFLEFLEISVSDSGTGIGTADLYRLFQPFTQLDSSRSRAAEGSGLGLVMVRRLVELQQGAILVESEPGQGSTFRVWLPLRDPDRQRALPIALPAAVLGQLAGKGRP